MLGRGLLSCPDLARQIKTANQQLATVALSWIEIVELLAQFCIVTENMYDPKYVGNRVKQWLGYLRRQYPQANQLFEQIKRLRSPEEIASAIANHKKGHMRSNAA